MFRAFCVFIVFSLHLAFATICPAQSFYFGEEEIFDTITEADDFTIIVLEEIEVIEGETGEIDPCTGEFIPESDDQFYLHEILLFLEDSNEVIETCAIFFEESQEDTILINDTDNTTPGDGGCLITDPCALTRNKIDDVILDPREGRNRTILTSVS